MQYCFVALVPCRDGGYAIFSPDFPELSSRGTDYQDCKMMADECLRAIVKTYDRELRPLPEPHSLETARTAMDAFLQHECRNNDRLETGKTILFLQMQIRYT